MVSVGGKPLAVFGFTVVGDRIVEVEIMADAATLEKVEITEANRLGPWSGSPRNGVALGCWPIAPTGSSEEDGYKDPLAYPARHGQRYFVPG